MSIVYGTIKDGEFVSVGKIIKTDRRVIVNPTPEQYLECGYLPSIQDEIPEYDSETQELRHGTPYIEEGVIHRTYEVVDI